MGGGGVTRKPNRQRTRKRKKRAYAPVDTRNSKQLEDVPSG